VIATVPQICRAVAGLQLGLGEALGQRCRSGAITTGWLTSRSIGWLSVIPSIAGRLPENRRDWAFLVPQRRPEWWGGVDLGHCPA
jgi:hypothetical protein